MKISSDTIKILKNYSDINPNIVLQGNVITTTSPGKNIYSESEITETFPVEAGIYDLKQLLSVISLYKEPEFDFHDQFVYISQDSNVTKYWYFNPKLLQINTKKFTPIKLDVEFDLSKTQLQNIINAGSVLGVPDVCFYTDKEGFINVGVTDRKNTTSNKFDIKLKKNDTNINFEVYVKLEYLKFLPFDYKVGINTKMAVAFHAKDRKTQYWVSIEK